MGGGLSYKRCMEGKTPQNYFHQNVYPKLEIFLQKLNIDRRHGLQMFKVFCRIGKDNSGTVSIDELLLYFGQKSKFTIRVFQMSDEIDISNGSFQDFVLCIWFYCSLSHSLLVRYVWEIFDIDRKGILGRPDIETMYKLLYDCDDFDKKQIARLPFTSQPQKGEEEISLVQFTAFTEWRTHIIQPAVDFRNRLRRKLGGRLYWENIVRYRGSIFVMFDGDENISLQESFNRIAGWENPNPVWVSHKMDADEMIRNLKREMTPALPTRGILVSRGGAPKSPPAAIKEEEEEEEEEDFLDEEGDDEDGNVIQEASNDRDIDNGWLSFETLMAEREYEDFYNDEITFGLEHKEKLYLLYEEAVKSVELYWEEKDQEEAALVLGVPEDHELRTQDYLETREGRSEFTRILITNTILIALDEIAKVKEKTKVHQRSNREIDLCTALINIGKLNRGIERRAAERKAAIAAGVSPQDLDDMIRDTTENEESLMRLIASIIRT